MSLIKQTRSPVDRSTTKKIENTGDLVASVAVTGRADLTDTRRAILEPLLPVGKKPGRPPKWIKQQLIDGISWRIRVARLGCGRPRSTPERATVHVAVINEWLRL